jgi:hypothetical protein
MIVSLGLPRSAHFALLPANLPDAVDPDLIKIKVAYRPDWDFRAHS